MEVFPLLEDGRLDLDHDLAVADRIGGLRNHQRLAALQDHGQALVDAGSAAPWPAPFRRRLPGRRVDDASARVGSARPSTRTAARRRSNRPPRARRRPDDTLPAERILPQLPLAHHHRHGLLFRRPGRRSDRSASARSARWSACARIARLGLRLFHLRLDRLGLFDLSPRPLLRLVAGWSRGAARRRVAPSWATAGSATSAKDRIKNAFVIFTPQSRGGNSAVSGKSAITRDANSSASAPASASGAMESTIRASGAGIEGSENS